MTKDEILEYFKDINHAYNDCTRYDTLKRMIDELQEPCGDAISRQAVAEVLLKYAHSTVGKAFAEFLISQINNLPLVTPQPKMGEWYLADEWRCSVCNCVCEDWRGIPTYKYCPQCGSYVGKRQEVEE